MELLLKIYHIQNISLNLFQEQVSNVNTGVI